MYPVNQRPQSPLDPLAVHYVIPCVTAHVLASREVRFLYHESLPGVTCGECLDRNSGGMAPTVAGEKPSLVPPNVKELIRWKQNRGQARLRPGVRRVRR